MESVIRRLEETELPVFAEIAIQAFPANKKNTPEFKQKFTENLARTEQAGAAEYFGLFREGKLIAGMRFNTFEMNLFGKIVMAGGVGLVAVDLLHKKEKAAKELITFFISHYRAKWASLAMLYPFRPDFYKKMGFGYGIKMNQYKIRPDSFPSDGSKAGLQVLGPEHAGALMDCYNRFARKTHGMLLKNEFTSEAIFRNPDNRVIGFFDGGSLAGYLVYGFEPADTGNFLRTNLAIREFIYETPRALRSMAAFLNTQSDQIERVILNTQDDSLEYMIDDPRNGSGHLIPSVYHETNTAGVGLMYRLLDLDRVADDFSGRNFNGGNARFTLVVHDSFQSAEPKRAALQLINGFLSSGDEESSDFEIEMDISDLSSLLVGSADAERLHRYGLLHVSDPSYLEEVIKAFRSSEKPFCITPF